MYNFSMEIITSKNRCIITPLSPKLDELETERLKNEVTSVKDLDIGIDLSYVKDCSIEFIEEIKKHKNISLFNISSDIFALLTFMKLDKILNLYVSELDYLENCHRIVKRNFELLQTCSD